MMCNNALMEYNSKNTFYFAMQETVIYPYLLERDLNLTTRQRLPKRPEPTLESQIDACPMLLIIPSSLESDMSNIKTRK
jgi:hypothetical protein